VIDTNKAVSQAIGEACSEKVLLVRNVGRDKMGNVIHDGVQKPCEQQTSIGVCM
jgi:hypothetical protein